MEKEIRDDKMGILDIKAKLNGNINCNIEIQVVDEKDIEKRMLFYWSKMYSNSIKSGEEYNKLGKNIAILITDFEIKNLKEIEKFLTKWHIREDDYPKVVLTSVFELAIIELPKFEKYYKNQENKTLNYWINFINNPGVINMSDKEINEEIKKAKEVLEEISQDEHERYIAELRMKHIRDTKSVEALGYDKGLEAGIEQEKIKTVKKMIENGIDISLISKITELTEDEIKKIK